MLLKPEKPENLETISGKIVQPLSKWIIDSGASDHMTSTKSNLITNKSIPAHSVASLQMAQMFQLIVLVMFLYPLT